MPNSNKGLSFLFCRTFVFVSWSAILTPPFWGQILLPEASWLGIDPWPGSACLPPLNASVNSRDLTYAKPRTIVRKEVSSFFLSSSWSSESEYWLGHCLVPEPENVLTGLTGLKRVFLLESLVSDGLDTSSLEATALNLVLSLSLGLVSKSPEAPFTGIKRGLSALAGLKRFGFC